MYICPLLIHLVFSKPEYTINVARFLLLYEKIFHLAIFLHLLICTVCNVGSYTAEQLSHLEKWKAISLFGTKPSL